MSTTIRLDGELNTNLLEVLTNLCVDLQKQFDISPELLNSWINSPSFQKHLEESHDTVMKQLQREEQGQPSVPLGPLGGAGPLGPLGPEPVSVPGLPSLSSVAQSQHAAVITGSNEPSLSNPEERCGKLLKTYSNGYEELCNEHKYVHETLDHEFVIKSEALILRERKFEREWRRINEYGKGMYERAWAYLQNFIEKHYTRKRYSTRELERVRPHLEANRRIFKSRIAINEVSVEGGTKNKKPKYVYGPHFDLFTPKEDVQSLD